MAGSGIDRQPVTDLDLTACDSLPRFAEVGQPDVVDGQVLARGTVCCAPIETVDVVPAHL